MSVPVVGQTLGPLSARNASPQKNFSSGNENTLNREESLSEKIRNNPGLELSRNELTDQLKSGNMTEDSDVDDEESEDSVRQRANLLHLDRLRKPIHQIVLGTNISDQPTPDNKAETVAEPGPPIFIGALGYTLPCPDRYTVCQSHRPLYFEQPNLERCGNGLGILQNAVSGATFLANTIVLPYKMGKQRPDCEVYSRGDCKSCQSYDCGDDLLPVDRHGVTLELAAIAGFSFLFL